MTFTINGSICKIVKERSDKRFRSDSDVFFRLRNLMRKQGYDVVKRNMEQDGHLMANRHTFYIRQRNWRFAIYDGDYAIRSVAEHFNEHGIVRLTYERWEPRWRMRLS